MADEMKVTVSGPLFDGTAARAVQEFVDDARDEIGQHAEDLVLARLGTVLQHPTGYYESQVRARSAGADTVVVSDGGVIYGAWLEGVGSRNFPATRFKGYQHWRESKQAAQRDAPEIADRLLRVRYLPEMR